MEDKVQVSNSAQIAQNCLLAEVRLSMKEILKDAVRRQATYQV